MKRASADGREHTRERERELTSLSLNMFCPTMVQLLFEYVSSQINFDDMLRAVRKSLCPELPLAAGNRALRRERRTRAERVTSCGSRVRWRQ